MALKDEEFRRVSKLGYTHWLTIYHPVNIDVPGMAKSGYIQENVMLDDEDVVDCVRKIEDGMKDAIYRK